MASTTALFTGLSGLNAHSKNLDAIGNNIANVNTTAFKSSRLVFSPMFSRTLSGGSAPGDTTGGTNPKQIGMGVAVAGTQRDFAGGPISATGDQRDLAVEGDGFFVVSRGENERLFTRAGSFRQNSVNDLVTVTGERVQGFGVDANFNILSGAVGDVNIPVGSLTIAQATRNLRFAGNLNAAGALPARGASIDILGTATMGFGLIGAATSPPTPPDVLAPANLLADVEDPQLPGSGAPLFAPGQTLEVASAEKGGKTLPTAQFPILATSTVQDLMDFLALALGLQSGAGANPDGAAPGVSLNTRTGALTITGHTGTVNDLAIDSSDLRLLDAGGALLRQPLVADKNAAADGESVRTTFVAFDSLGTPVRADLSMVLDSRSNAGTTWRYTVDSADDTDAALTVATGTISFDTSGQLITTEPVTVTIDRDGTGAESPLTLDLAFAGDADNVTALSDTASGIAATFQDGSPIGTLSGYAVGADGIITGSFTNGLTRTVGQIALATFTNPEGLFDEGSNMFTPGANSGEAVVTIPGSLGAGRVVGGALELSNVDLGQEFINMILTSTGYSASSRVIRTTDELIQQLLVLGR